MTSVARRVACAAVVACLGGCSSDAGHAVGASASTTERLTPTASQATSGGASAARAPATASTGSSTATSAPAAPSAAVSTGASAPLDLAALLAAQPTETVAALSDGDFTVPTGDAAYLPAVSSKAAPADAPWVFAPADVRLRRLAGWTRAHPVGVWGVHVSSDKRARLLFTGIPPAKSVSKYVQELGTIYRMSRWAWQPVLSARIGSDMPARLAIGRAVQDSTEYRVVLAVGQTARPERLVLVLVVAPDAPPALVEDAVVTLGSVERAPTDGHVCDKYLVEVQRCLTTLARQAEASTDEQVGIRRDFLELGAEQLRELTRTATPTAVEKACTKLFSELQKYACDG